MSASLVGSEMCIRDRGSNHPEPPKTTMVWASVTVAAGSPTRTLAAETPSVSTESTTPWMLPMRASAKRT
eukprot:5335448-Alexandrium_andersonii.AAC.1